MTSTHKIIDISIPIQPGMPQWPGDDPVTERPLSRTPEDVANVTQLVLTTHTGTHVDPPRHFVHDGATIDEVPLERWIGRCWVADLTGSRPEVEVAELEAAGIPDGTQRLLLKTTNTDLWRSRPAAFVEQYVALSLPAAGWVVERGIRLIGIDYLSIGGMRTTNVETHQLLLGNDVIVVEGLDLVDVEPGPYELLCMPLKIRAGDGAPARVALRGPLG
ncbi:MAG TPA: cyclase family protein [Thermomicrobiales bacterium]|nr:cyclase family protein [Thermomicrobiales bacterium]